MKKLLSALTIVILATRLLAQSNAPVRLALVAETDEAATALDVLTAQLSGNQKIQLLERNEIEKVYREQGLPAVNKDYLKLGQILGADGLLLLDVVRTPQATNLMTRLIAVKPGVVLTDGSFPWPLKDIPSWAESVATYLNSFLPKLALLPKDAIPISVVNLRSAVQSADGQEAERQLKLLAIQRLSQERQFFVLERQQMQLLSEEKELKVDDSAFWNGSYLLEGVVDQNGYSKETITINARLTPPKGGAPLLMEVSGSRTNYSEVINRLAAKVTELLKVNSAIKEWNAVDEAQQYYEETRWALRWGVFSEAEAAADSAWALGKRDLDCALVRVKSYVSEVSADAGRYQASENINIMSPGFFADGKTDGSLPTDADVQAYIKELSTQHHLGIAYQIQDFGKIKTVEYVFIDQPPAPKNIARAMHALELYNEFSQTSSADILKFPSATSNWRNSDWYDLGVEDLITASKVLQNFNFVPESQKPVAEKLAELRALTRSVTEWVSKSPSVHDSYFVGDRVAVYDELYHFEEKPSIFNCEVKWGCFWQERPEDCIALYNELMSSPVFSYIHKDLWLRDLQTPRLVAWNENDRQRVPMVWNDFVRELKASTNVLLQLEANALAFADADSEKQMAASFTNLFNCIFENRDALVANSVEVLYLNWGLDDLVNAKTGNGIVTDTKNSLQQLFYSQYRPKLEAMDQEYRSKTVPAKQVLSAFVKQKQYLKENKPYDFIEFVNLFQEKNYSKTQALEIQPLIVAYKSNLVAQSQTAPWNAKGKLMGAIAQVGFLEDDVNRILNPPAPKPRVETVQNTNPRPVAIAPPPGVPRSSQALPEIVTNVLLVKNYLTIPPERLKLNKPEERLSDLRFSNPRFYGGRLWLDFRYQHGYRIYFFNAAGDWTGTGGTNFDCAAVVAWDPKSEAWEIIPYPDTNFPSFYDIKTRQWKILNVSGLNGSRLFAIDGQLYAASGESILEIIDGGKGTRILASTRRRPAASALDALDSLGSPILFSGINHLLCASIGNKIYSWDGNDWHEVLTLNISQAPEIFEDTVIFRLVPSYGSGDPANLWVWEKNQTAPELCLHDKPKPHPQINLGRDNPDKQTLCPLWKSPEGDYLTGAAATFYKSNLYFFVDHCIVTNVSGHWTVAEMDGYHAKLVCLSRDLPEPIVVPLKFDLQRGQPPLESLGEKVEPAPWLTGSTWIFFAGDTLYIGQPDTPGIWTIPLSEIEAAIAAQKQIQLEQKSKDDAEAKSGKTQ